MAFNLFGNKGSVAKVPSTLMVAIASTDSKQRQSMDFVLRKWKVHVDANHIHNMKFNISGVTKKRSIYYFSPYTFDCFLRYLGKLIDQETYIPNTNKQTLSGFKATTYLLDNIWKRNHHDEIMTNHKGIPYVMQVDTVKKYPEVPYNDEDERCYATYIVYNLLFFSYTREALDNVEHLSTLYKNNKDIANEFQSIFQNEYKASHNNKPIGKGQIATMPTYKAFVDRNQDSVYIPNLTTDLQKKNAKTDRRDYDLNVYNIGEHNTNVNGHLRTAMEYKEMREKDKMVDSMIDKKARASEQAYIHAERAKAISSKRHKAIAEEWRKRAKATADARLAAKRKKERSNNVNGRKTKKSLAPQKQKASKNDSVMSTVSKIAAKGAKAKTKPNKNSSKNNKKPNNSNSKASKTKDTEKTTTTTKAKGKNPAQAPVPKQRQSVGLIDYSSSKQPYIMTDNTKILSQAIQDAFSYHNGLNNPVHFQLMNADKKLPSPESPEIALKTGHLDSQRYVQQEINDFKKLANNFILHEEHDLNMAEERSEKNITAQAITHLNRRLRQLVSQYSDDTPLTKSALQYYKANLNDAISSLRKGCAKELQIHKKALQEQMNSQYNTIRASIHRYFNQEMRRIQATVNNNTVQIYQQSRARRDAEIHHNLREMKSEAKKALSLQLQNHHIEFAHHASKANNLLFSFFARQLKQNKSTWVSTVSEMIEAQAKDEAAKARLKRASVEAERTKNGTTRRAKLQQEVDKAQKYADDMEARYEDKQDHYLDLRNKLLKRADENDNLRNRIDDLKEDVNSSNTEVQQNLSAAQSENQRLRQIIDHKNKLAAKMNDSITKLTQSREDYSANLDNASNTLETYKMQSSQYKKMLEHQREQSLKASQKATTWYQRYTNMKIALDNTNANNKSALNSAVQSASVAQTKASMSMSASVSKAFSSSIRAQDYSRSTLFNKKLSAKESEVAKARSIADSKVSSANYASKVASQSNAIQRKNDSIAQSAASASASIAQVSARSIGASLAISSAQRAYSLRASTASAQDSRRASLSASTVNSIKASAEGVVKSAERVRNSMKANNRTTAKSQASAESVMNSIKSSASAVQASAMKASASASNSNKSALNKSNAVAKKSLQNSSISTSKAQKAEIQSAVKQSVSESMAQVKVQNSKDQAQMQAQQSKEASMSARNTSRPSNASSSSTNGMDAFAKVEAMDKDTKINNLQRKINEMNNSTRSKRKRSHKHWWQS